MDRECDLLRESWAQAALDRSLAAQLFYGRLFEQRPDLRAMFGSDMIAQGQKLMDTLNFVVDNIGQSEVLEKPVAELGHRHRGYGVKDEDYQDVGAALLWTFRNLLGDGFDADVEQAWLSVYTQISDRMKTA
ncbi:MAG: globin domain-containing protein [Pseudomonadota bacterium]